MEVATMTPLICLFCLTHDFETIASGISDIAILFFIFKLDLGGE